MKTFIEYYNEAFEKHIDAGEPMIITNADFYALRNCISDLQEQLEAQQEQIDFIMKYAVMSNEIQKVGLKELFNSK